MELRVGVAGGLGEVPAAAWDALGDPDDPFTEHAFLRALEVSGSVGEGTGWAPAPVLVHRAPAPRSDAPDRAAAPGEEVPGGELVGAAPCYVKAHSTGEFVFDWSWAAAAGRARVPYYPKLVVAVPFTPAGGRRLLVHPALAAADRDRVRAALARGLLDLAAEVNASSVHVLFCREEEARSLEEQGFHTRLGWQYHWRNRSPPYRDLEDYLDAFTARMRKQARHERAVARSGLTVAVKEGRELTADDWAALRRFYLATAERHGGADYLTAAFFDEARTTLAPRVLASLAYEGTRAVAGTLNFERGRCLFGRYWGADRERPMLHFELAYYALIERAVARGHLRFEAGAGGEHKVRRGLLPTATFSAHLVRHRALDQAVARFCQEEAAAVRAHIAEEAGRGPFKRG